MNDTAIIHDREYHSYRDLKFLSGVVRSVCLVNAVIKVNKSFRKTCSELRKALIMTSSHAEYSSLVRTN